MKKLIRLRKIDAVKYAAYRTPSKKEYNYGNYNEGISLPIDYWVEGYLLAEPTVGKTVVVDRVSRNGEKVSGMMVTSTVTEVFEGGFKTLNSVYKIDYI
jgi:hypothetical protein